MRSNVVIKSSKVGMTVILDPQAPFDVILEEVAIKFRESAKFWGSVQMTLTLEGRMLTAEEEIQIVNTITENSSIEILCLVDTDAQRIERCEKTLNRKLMELSSQTGQFYRGTLRRGDVLESEASIVVIGDVNHGARVIARGNIIILGELKGSVHAGVTGNETAVVVAFEMAPMQIKIAGYSSNFAEKGKRLAKGPVIASVENSSICTTPIKKSFLNALNFI